MRSLPSCLGAVLSISQQVIIKSWCPLLLMIYSQGDPRALFSMRNCQTYFWSVAHLWMVTLLGGKWSNWEKLAASLWEVMPSCTGTALARAADSSPSAFWQPAARCSHAPCSRFVQPQGMLPSMLRL